MPQAVKPAAQVTDGGGGTYVTVAVAVAKAVTVEAGRVVVALVMPMQEHALL